MRRFERVGRAAETDRTIPTDAVTPATSTLTSATPSNLTSAITSAITPATSLGLSSRLNEPFDCCMRRISHQQAMPRGHLDNLPCVTRPNPNRVAPVRSPCVGFRRGFARLHASSSPLFTSTFASASASVSSSASASTSLRRPSPWPLSFVASRVPRGACTTTATAATTTAATAVSAATVTALPLERHPALAADERDVNQATRRQHLGRRSPGQKV